MPKLTHMDEEGNARMVDVGGKAVTRREALAEGWISLSQDAYDAVLEGQISKGDVLTIAQVAGIQAAKKTSDWVPLCHPLALTGIRLILKPVDGQRIRAEARVRCEGKTGVEMEALCAVSGALLCIYDMLKAIDKAMVIGPIQLCNKSGGASGDWSRD
ncbi:MAG: cyclic pyranopterin monophosphate synthase MoaC [Myxococcota bacterium]|jgi:cyclic pyranopterin phosphate synthase|nr:cyclic pyranopterin monophosphate synthase MoaC [Myxococcota bacterium]